MEQSLSTKPETFLSPVLNSTSRGLSRFLSLSSCPEKGCRATLELVSGQLVCTSPNHKHTFNLSPEGGFFRFTLPDEDSTTEWATKSIYASERIARHYAGLWGFAHQTLYDPDQYQKGYFISRGESDMFYRIITELALERLSRDNQYDICDIGCGVGRLTYDFSALYPNSFVTGFDISENMLRTASKFLFTPFDFNIDLSDAGFGVRRIDRQRFPPQPNTFIFQANAEYIPFRTVDESGGFDLVLNINVLDRTLQPNIVLQSSLDIVKPGGFIIIAISSSWQEDFQWKRFGPTLDWCVDTLNANGFELKFGVDRVIFREITNSRGAFEEFPITVLMASRKV